MSPHTDVPQTMETNKGTAEETVKEGNKVVRQLFKSQNGERVHWTCDKVNYFATEDTKPFDYSRCKYLHTKHPRNGKDVKLRYFHRPATEIEQFRLMLISGAGQPVEGWAANVQHMIENFGDHVSFVVTENPGTMASSYADTMDWTVNDYAKNHHDLASHLGWDSYHFAGTSMGGMIGLRILANPEWRSRVITAHLVNTHAGGVRAFPPLQSFFGLGGLVVGQFMGNPKNAISSLMYLLYSDDLLANPERKSRQLESMTSGEPPEDFNPLGQVGQYFATLRYSVSNEELQDIRESGIPVKVCVPGKDLLVRPSNGPYLREAINAHYDFYPHAAHASPEECHREFNSRLVAFMGRYQA
eukprot:Clim_evm22s172 gene=Clim_evmTU22s172